MIALSIASVLCTGVLNRFRGTGGKFYFFHNLFTSTNRKYPRTGVGKARILVGICIAVFSWLFAHYVADISIINSLYTLAAIPLIWAGLSLGWGSYMDQGQSTNRDNEIFRSFLDLFPPLHEQLKPDGSIYANPLRDFIGMTLNGLCIFVPTLLLFGIVYNYWWISLPISIVCAILFSIIYKIASYIHIGVDRTAIAEIGAGMLMGTMPITLLLT